MEGARTLTGPDRRMAMQKAGEDYQTALNGILTPAQKTKLQALMAEARELRGLGPIGQQLLSVKPALTADQKSKVKAIAAKYQPEMQNFRRGRGGPGGGAAGGDPNARTERRALMEKVAAEVKAVLTPEQQSTLRPLGGRRGLRGQQQ
jgi:Spy/CpxP family protein refolding chaperone